MKMNKILNEIYKIDPTMKKHEAKLNKILKEMLKNKPDIVISKQFVNDLQKKLKAKAKGFEKKAQLKQMRRWIFAFSGLTAVILLLAFGGPYFYKTYIKGESPVFVQVEKIDDWAFDYSKEEEDAGFFRSLSQKAGVPSMKNMALETSLAPADGMGGGDFLGFSVGGAKDINNFRENIENNYLPLPTDITYEGLFYDYYFNTGKAQECKKLFCPSYSYAISKDPISGKDDYYLSVGLNSNLKESDFERKKLNLVVVLDMSGSMSSQFNKYYYDQFGNQLERENFTESNKTKMEIANESVVALLDHLNEDDRFGMVLFDDSAYLAKPLNYVGNTDMDSIAKHILEIQPMGGTNMEAGMKEGTDLFDELGSLNPDEYENRIIFLTDAMPNLGDTTRGGLFSQLENNSKDSLYTTFIGIGVDFNTDLVESLTKIRGANYYSVHSEDEFKTRMDDEFEFMVMPLVFDLNLILEAEGYDIEKVYGSPEADEATGQIMKVNTLFPSKTKEGETKGGIVLLKLKKTSENGKLVLKTTYEDRSGKKDSDEKIIDFEDKAADYYQNTGIQKGILLSRYTDLIKNWIIDEREYYSGLTSSRMPEPEVMEFRITEETGLIAPWPYELGQWERQSLELVVSEHYIKIFEEFAAYFQNEMNKIGDNTLQQELDILQTLSTVRNHPALPPIPHESTDKVDDWMQ